MNIPAGWPICCGDPMQHRVHRKISEAQNEELRCEHFRCVKCNRALPAIDGQVPLTAIDASVEFSAVASNDLKFDLDLLTIDKTKHILSQYARPKASGLGPGARITGVVMTLPGRGKCIVDMSAVRWFDKAEKFFEMMHPSEFRNP